MRKRKESAEKESQRRRIYPTGRTARLLVPRPVGLEPPRVKAPGPSRAGAGLGPATLAWRTPGLALLRPVSPFSEAAARPWVNGPRRLGFSLATRLWCRGRLGAQGGLTGHGRIRGVSTRAVRSARPLLWRSHPRGVGVASRRTLEDPVKARRHPLRIVVIIIVVPTIILARGFFFRLPPLPGFSSTRL